jgi:cell division protease FtsH
MTNDIIIKNKMIDDAIVQLKKEFIGIDYQIDTIMDNLRTWFLFPELQERPMIINLFGMSGCGKTSLVKRISQLLNIEKDYVYFNFAKIDEMSSWEIEDSIEDELSNEHSNRMFVYDEFQYAATLDELGNEKAKKSGLKTFWELLDTGILQKRYSYNTTRYLFQIGKRLELINNKVKIKLDKNGVWINSDECLQYFTSFEKDEFNHYFNFRETGKGKTQNSEYAVDMPVRSIDDYQDESVSSCVSEGDFILKNHVIERLYNVHDKSKGDIDLLEFNHALREMDAETIIKFIWECALMQQKGYSLNFKDSVIFVIANLDEAYQMSFDVNPDMSPDQFHEITKKLTIVEIKESLQKRFRNEQIARLGNIHVIYPSFSSENFKEIIRMEIDSYVRTTKEKTGYNIEYNNSIVELIYKEGVFPTHGTRPVYSTIQEIIRSKLPFVIKNCHMDGKSIDTIRYSFNRGNTCAEVFNNGDKVGEYKFKEKLRVENLRQSKKDDNQAITAVHESGHFVIYAKLHNALPKQVRSVCTDPKANGFIQTDDDKDFKSAKDILDDIKVSLGGYVAEEMIFGREHLTAGSSSDLRNATILASKYVRDYCLGTTNYVSTYMTDINTTECGSIVNEDNQTRINEEIKNVLQQCWGEVRNTFRQYEWMKMLKASAKYLSTHSCLTKKKMQEMYDLVSDKVKNTTNNDSYYKDIVDKF